VDRLTEMDQMKTINLAKTDAQEPKGQGFPETRPCFGGSWPGQTHFPDNVAKRGSGDMGETRDL
jgi:hypothetical protein